MAAGVLDTPGSLPDLELSLFCGEPLPRSLVEEWHSVAPNSRVLNLYGPTECTVDASEAHIAPELHRLEGPRPVPGHLDADLAGALGQHRLGPGPVADVAGLVDHRPVEDAGRASASGPGTARRFRPFISFCASRSPTTGPAIALKSPRRARPSCLLPGGL